MLQLTFEYMPYYYDDDLQLIPNDFSDPDNLRFVIEQDYTSAFSIFTNPDDESSSFESSFLEQWFHRLQAFPLFVCVEVNRYDEEEFEALCRFCSITYNDLTPLADKRFIVAELKHVTDFQHLYSYLHSHVSWNDLVIWSTKPNVFRIEYRTHYYSDRPEKTGIVSMQENMSIFAFSYDADVVNVVSNQPFFETADRLFNTLPDFVIPTLIDDTEDIQKRSEQLACPNKTTD